MSGILNVVATSGGRLAVVVTPDTATGSGSSGGAIFTNSVTASLPGATFLWSFVSGDDAVIATMPLDSATQRWSSALEPGAEASASWKVSAYIGGALVAEAYVTPFIQRF